MKKILSLIVLANLVTVSCEQELPEQSGCSENRPTLHVVENASGRLVFDERLSGFVIRYDIEGTIDSQWIGLLCDDQTSELPELEHSRVTFSGEFKDDAGALEPEPRLGGRDYFYLTISAIEERPVKANKE